PNATTFAAALIVPVKDTESASATSRDPHHATHAASESSSTRRVVEARVAIYTAIAGVAAGLVAGWALAHSSIDGPWRSDTSPRWPPASTAAKVAAIDDRGKFGGSSTDGLSLVLVDRAGRLQRRIAANRPWTPRFSPEGRRVAYGAFGVGRGTSDLWVTDLDAGTTKRLTDDDADSNDPQWSPDGTVVAYSVSAPGGKDIAARRLADGA